MSWGKVYTQALGAGGSATLGGGRYFKLIQAAAAVTVEVFSDAGEPLATFEGVSAGLSFDIQKFIAAAPLVGFGKVKITSATAQTVAAIVSRQPIDYDNVATSVTPVSGSGLSNAAPLTVGAAEVAAFAAGSGRRALVFMADPANAGVIELGATGLAYGNNPIRLEAGDVWVETDRADAAWYAIASAAGQTLRRQSG